MENILKQIYASSEKTTKAMQGASKTLAQIVLVEKQTAQETAKQRKEDEKTRKREVREKKREGVQKKKDADAEKKANKKQAKDNKEGVLGTIGGMVGGLSKFLTGNGLIKLLGGALIGGIAGWAIWKNKDWLAKNVWEPVKKQWDEKVMPMWENKIKPWIEKEVWAPLKNELKYFGGVIKKELTKWLDKEVLAPIGNWVESKLGIATNLNDGQNYSKNLKFSPREAKIAIEEAEKRRSKHSEAGDRDKVAEENRRIDELKRMRELGWQLENQQKLLKEWEDNQQRYQEEFDTLEGDMSPWAIVRRFALKNSIKGAEQWQKDTRKRIADLERNMSAHNSKQNLELGVQKRQRGGHINVPGSGNGDQVPMLLPSGSFVMNRNAAALFQTGGMIPTLLEPGEKVFTPGQWGPMHQMMNDIVPRFQTGGEVSNYTVAGVEYDGKTGRPVKGQTLAGSDGSFDSYLAALMEEEYTADKHEYGPNGEVLGVKKDDNLLESIVSGAKTTFSGIANSLLEFLGPVGEIISNFLGSMGEAFSQLGFGEGIMNLFTGGGSGSDPVTSLLGGNQQESSPSGQHTGGNVDIRSKAQAGDATDKRVLNIIASVEADQNDPYGGFNTSRGRTAGRATDKTIGWLARNARGAVGRYQHMPRFLLQRARDAGYSADTKFTPEVQDRLTLDFLKRDTRGKYEKWKNSGANPEALADELSRIWRGLPHSSGGTYPDQYAGQNAAHMSRGQFMQELKAARNLQKKQTGGVVNLQGGQQSGQARYQQAQAQFAEMIASATHTEPIIVYEDEPTPQVSVATSSAGNRSVPSLPDGPATSHAAQYMYKVALGGVR